MFDWLIDWLIDWLVGEVQSQKLFTSRLCVEGLFRHLSVNDSDSSQTWNRWEYSETRRTQPVKSDFSAWNVCSLNTVLFSQTFQTVTPNGVKAHLDSNSLTQKYSHCTVAFSLTDFFFHSVTYCKWGFEGWCICFWKNTKIYYKTKKKKLVLYRILTTFYSIRVSAPAPAEEQPDNLCWQHLLLLLHTCFPSSLCYCGKLLHHIDLNSLTCASPWDQVRRHIAPSGTIISINIL